MKRALLLLIFALSLGYLGWGQVTTVFTDDFSTNTSATYTTSGAIGASSWSVTRSGADWGSRRNTSPTQLESTNDVGGTANVAGWAFPSVALSSFSSPFNTTLSSNPGMVTWTFNFRTNRSTALSGFGATTSYGMAMILAATTNTPNTTGNGYAVVMGGGTNNNIALISFNNGLQGTRTTIIGFGNTPTNVTDYLSVKVTYNPTGNNWELFSRDDGTTAFADPAVGSLTQIGVTTSNSTYTGTAMSYLGAYWQGSTTATQTAFFDNVKTTVTVLTTPPTLTAAVGATVDAPFDVTFTDDATWRAAITGITVGGTTLTAGSSVAAGAITFTPSASVPTNLLQTSGTKSIAVIATGYSNATVNQDIGVGVTAKLGMKTQPAAPASNGALLATQPAVYLQDQYGNTTASTADVVAAVGAGTWTLGGTTTVAGDAGTSTFTNLTATSAAAVTGATIAFTSIGLTGTTSNTFIIPAPPLSGTYTVGSGGNYTSFTKVDGLFASINSSGLAGNVTINVTSDILDENGATSLNQWTEYGGSGYTLTIQPSGGAARTISGTVGGAPLINFNGADRVTINGLNTGGNSLIISNLSTAATSGTSTIKFVADATGNTITNCSILGSATMTLATSGGNIFFNTGTTTGNDNNTISYCKIAAIPHEKTTEDNPLQMIQIKFVAINIFRTNFGNGWHQIGC